MEQRPWPARPNRRNADRLGPVLGLRGPNAPSGADVTSGSPDSDCPEGPKATKDHPRAKRVVRVGMQGFEPWTSTSRTWRAAKLRYIPLRRHIGKRPSRERRAYRPHRRSANTGGVPSAGSRVDPASRPRPSRWRVARSGPGPPMRGYRHDPVLTPPPRSAGYPRGGGLGPDRAGPHQPSRAAPHPGEEGASGRPGRGRSARGGRRSGRGSTRSGPAPPRRAGGGRYRSATSPWPVTAAGRSC